MMRGFIDSKCNWKNKLLNTLVFKNHELRKKYFISLKT